MGLEYVSDNFWFVFFAYVAAFAPWTAIAAKDFISSTWKTVKRTRRAGYGNLFWSVIPALYVIAYCTIKGVSRDYSETCAALVASVFAFLHMLRTLWGLWQLEQFRSWAEKSILALRAMGVEYTLPQYHEGLDEYGRENRDGKLSAADIADHLLVNDKIIDNQIMHGEIHCYLKYGDVLLLTQAEEDSEFLARCLVVTRWIRVVGLVAGDIFRRLLGRKGTRKFEQVPIKPMAVWVHWATLFASQGLEEWINNFDVRTDPDKDGFDDSVSAMDKFYARGRYFASEVFSSAAMQLWPESESKNVLNPFLWQVWDEQNNMSDGRVVKHELLSMAMKGGDALPFGTPHVGKFLSLRGASRRPGYDSYREALGKFVGELPTESVYLNEIRTFDVEKLECLTILLHLGALSRKVQDMARAASSSQADSRRCNENDDEEGRNDLARGASRESDSESSPSPASQSTESASDCDAGRSEQAASNLRAQLNMTGNGVGRNAGSGGSGGILDHESTSVAILPAMGKRAWETSEGNRLVCKSGELVDAWVALVAGEQISFMVEKLNGSWTDLCLGRDGGTAVTEGDDDEERGKLRRIHCELEKRRLAWRIADWRHRYGFRDQFVTFMGYRMESVRSAMASWVSLNEEEQADDFFEKLRCQEVRVPVKLSEAMTTLVKSDRSFLTLQKRGVQTRLVWELQNALDKKCHTSMRDGSTMDLEAPGAVVLLFILSFPSLRIHVGRSTGAAEEACGKGECCCIELGLVQGTRTQALAHEENCLALVEIVAICGPQKLAVVVEIDVDGVCVLTISGGERGFKWRWWRDAFLGRLEGFKEWQEEHEIQSVELLRSVAGKGIVKLKTATGTTFQTWRDWRPFRLGFCLFELESEGFLQQPCVTHSKTPFMRSKNSHIVWSGDFPVKKVQPVKYREAEDVVLMYSSVLVEEALDNQDTGGRAEAKAGTTESTVDGLMRMADGESRHSLLVLEMIAIQYGSVAALERSIDLLTSTRKGLEHFSRGPALLQSYVAHILSGPGIALQMSKESRKKMGVEVIPLLKKLLRMWGDRREAYESLSEVLKVHLASDPRVHISTVSSLLRLLLFLLDPSDASIRLLCDIECAIDWCEFANAEEEVRSSLGLDTHGGKGSNLSKENRRGQVHILEIAVATGYVDDRTREAQLEALQIDDARIWRTSDMRNHRLESYQQRVNKRDHARALTGLGLLLEYGPEGIEVDLRRSIALYQSSIEVGNDSFAMTSLGRILLNVGIDGMGKDPQRAAQLFQQAADKGNVVALMNLASLLKKGEDGLKANPKRAVELYQVAVDDYRDIDAMRDLGSLLRDGAEGVDRNAKRAKELYERAINEGGDATSMYYLARLLLQGAEGVEANAIRAAELLELAIDKGGNVDAMLVLANLLQNGANGVDPNPKRAKELCELAIKEGNHENSI